MSTTTARELELEYAPAPPASVAATLIVPHPDAADEKHHYPLPTSPSSPASSIKHGAATVSVIPHQADRPPGRQEVQLTDQTNLLPFNKIVAVFSGIALCALVTCLDSTIVATALPTIATTFQAGAVSSWVPSSYLLTSTAFQPICELPLTPVTPFFASLAETDIVSTRWQAQ